MKIHIAPILATRSIFMLRKIILNYGKSKTKSQIFILHTSYPRSYSYFYTHHRFTASLSLPLIPTSLLCFLFIHPLLLTFAL